MRPQNLPDIGVVIDNKDIGHRPALTWFQAPRPAGKSAVLRALTVSPRVLRTGAAYAVLIPTLVRRGGRVAEGGGLLNRCRSEGRRVGKECVSKCRTRGGR